MAGRSSDQEYFTAPVPADVDRPDTMLFGLTGRQLLILAGAALALWLGWTTLGHRAPLAYLIAVVPVAGTAFVVAVGRRDGRGLDVWLRQAVRFWRSPKQLIATTGDLKPPPRWVVTTSPVRAPAPLRLPARAISAHGVITLPGHGNAVLVAASTVNFALRSPGEQTGLIGGFARWLNSLDGPAQVLVRTRRVDLTQLADRIAEQAPSLPHPALEQAARAHVAFLDQIGTERELLDRQVTVAIRDTRGPHRAAQRAADTARALTACETNALVLDATAAAAVLGECMSPPATEQEPPQ